MSESRTLKLDLTALCLLAVVLFLAVSLATYQPADPVATPPAPLGYLVQAESLVYPANQEVANACGKWGALSANLIFTAFGGGGYYLVFSLAVFNVRILRREEVSMPAIRLAGWLATLFGFASVLAMLAPGLSPGPIIGSGGYLGALGRSMVETHFATAGGLILLTAITFAGVMLCTDYAIFHFMGQALSVGSQAAHRVQGLKLSIRRRTDLESSQLANDAEESDEYEEGEEEEETDEYEAEEDESGLAVRFRRKTTDLGSPAAGQGKKESKKKKRNQANAQPKIKEEPEQSEEEAEGETELAASAAPPSKKDASKKGPSKKKSVSKEEEPDEKHRVDKPISLRKPHEKTKREEAEREEVIQQLDEAARVEEDATDYELPSIDLLLSADDFSFERQEKEVRIKAKILEDTFGSFGFQVKVVEVETGPVIAQYEVELEAGLRLSRITGLADDLAIALRVPTVRIVAPIPGKNTVGIEVPNEERQIVRLREVMEADQHKSRKMHIPIFLGKDVSGNPMSVDLASLPHLLIAGRTGTGKSVCLNAIIGSILMTKRPDEVRMLMIDPKMVELSGYGSLPHLMHPVVTDMRKAEAILSWAVDKMEERYSLLAKAGVRHIATYNQLGDEELFERLQVEDEEQREAVPTHLPFIVIVADEIADMMMTAGKEVEQHIIRLAQKSRAVGIHLILATQKPTVDVITGLIKSNLPARIAFQVASRTDSRVVLDEMGADKLLGNGDMLFLWPGTSTLLRGQGTYLSDDEIDRVVEAASTGEQQFVHELINIKVEGGEEQTTAGLKKRDDLYESAIDIVVREGRGSVSLLQRALGVGYGRAARLIDFMADDNIVGPYSGSKAREVLLSVAKWEQMQGYDADEVSDDVSDEEPSADESKRKSAPRLAAPLSLVNDAEEILEDDGEYEDAAEELEDDEYESDEQANYEDEELEEESAQDEEEEHELGEDEEEYEEEEYEYEEETDDESYQAESA